ncbi:Male sterility NAD-binding [Penicillium robsamsonii]|uniref:Male sterility NAD-binding n=1 Tax=Penicillium robsamsonii TaxID=1792511 RepID=UPI0025490DB6|nr:Male sterility NAD-binding [Penicillium robsamsonii]KAJ5817233.1 Male sterility NAD-binding [Penicillium robsamsonii]
MDIEWFRGQVVFLTGATGNLGGCLLYKLTIQLPTAKIFVLVRGSVQKAIESWEQSMPEQVEEIIATCKIQFFLGDMTQPSLGLSPGNLSRLQNETTVVINAAGDIALSRDLPETIPINCTAHLTLAGLLESLTQLQRFLHISTTYVSSFLPDGVVKEQVYPLYKDPVEELGNILITGKSSYTKEFAAPYSLAKHLAECLLLSGDHKFPILIMRPCLISPAIEEPYPLYGSDGAIPIHSFIQILLGDSEYGPLKLEQTLPSHAACNEIPVDLVARTCLAHVAQGTTGVVHASADLYVSRTIGELLERMRRHAPEGAVEQVRKAGIDHGEVTAPEFYTMIQQFARDWKIECTRSTHLKQVAGPLGLDLGNHDPEIFFKLRIERLAKTLLEKLETASMASNKVYPNIT